MEFIITCSSPEVNHDQSGDYRLLLQAQHPEEARSKAEDKGHSVMDVYGEYRIWYDNGSGWYEDAGEYFAKSPDDAIRIAKTNGLSWAHCIVSEIDPNT